MFGIIMVISCEVGFLTPPVGANCICLPRRITNLGIDKFSVAVLTFSSGLYRRPGICCLVP